MDVLSVVILSIVQGAAELLPVSSSAHVIVAGSLLGLDPTSPEFTFLMVMLHTGTMGAVILFFYSRWKALLSGAAPERNRFVVNVAIATAITGAVGLTLKYVIEHSFMTKKDAQIEELFGNTRLIAASLLAVGMLIIFSGWRAERTKNGANLSYSGSFITGFMQGLCLPFRGFSRSGATISTGLVLGFSKDLAEEFSFALAVVLTPPVIARELWRLVKHAGSEGQMHAFSPALLLPGLGGMVLSFLSGWVALKLLANWIEKGRWSYFGYYCLAFSAIVLTLHPGKV